MDSGPPVKKLKLDTATTDDDEYSSHLPLQQGVGVAASIIDLPFEVLEQIFAHLPVYSLTSCRLVCKAWNSIIANPKFLRWKKHYHLVKTGHTDILSPVLLQSFRCSNNFISVLVRAVDTEFNNKLSDCSITPADPLRPLQLLPQFTCVSRIVSQLQGLLDEEKKSLSVPATVSLMVVFSHSVENTILLLRTLTSSSPLPLTHILELFYFLCYLFYQLWRQELLPHRLHYNVYYALNVFERLFVPKSNTKNGETKLTLTPEQLKIVGHNFNPGEIIKIVALAGTGKTTTLVKLVENNPQRSFLYTAFNKSMVSVATGLFTFSNVRCQTFHSIAHSGVQSLLNYPRSKLFNGNLEPYHLSGLVTDHNGAFKLGWVVKTLEDFFASDDEAISINHVPWLTEVMECNYENVCEDIEEKHRKKAFALAQIVWKEMLNLENDKVLLPHDGYLKLFQLQHPLIIGYDCILVDEAQDMTPAIKSIIDRQPCCKFFVGDPNQKIYSFRGAINALEAIEPDHTFYLTQSFRFGPNISYLTSCILDVLKGVHKQTITGSLEPGGFSGVSEGQVAFIARTNSVVFESMVEVCHARPDARIASSKSYTNELNTLKDLYRYMKETDMDKIKNKQIINKINKNMSFNDFKEQVNRSDNVALKRKIKLVEKYKDRIPDLTNLIQSVLTFDWTTADFIFTTAHKSKGLEFDTVVVCDDFLPSFFPKFQFHREEGSSKDENNLLYVAITRAKRQVFVNKNVIKILAMANEHRMFFRPPEKDEETTPPTVHCVVCSEEKPPSPIYRHGIQTSILSPVAAGDRYTSEGPVCGQCAGNHLPYLKELLL